MLTAPAFAGAVKALKNLRRFFDARGEDCVGLKFFGISGRPTDLWYCFFHQCAYWWKKPFPAYMPPETVVT
jgi:hypothetical protein